jgi:ribosomal protein L35AE/L33A
MNINPQTTDAAALVGRIVLWRDENHPWKKFSGTIVSVAGNMAEISPTLPGANVTKMVTELELAPHLDIAMPPSITDHSQIIPGIVD